MPNSPTGTPAAGAASSDASLAAGVRNGTFREARTALRKLYRRHQPPVTSQAYARALQAMRGGSSPEGAWSPYLLTTVCRTAAAWSLTARRTELAPDVETWRVQAAVTESGEERRRSAACPSAGGPLWHSAVERQSPDGTAALPGLSPSGAASLAARAREGLRAAYRAEHARDAAVPDECRHVAGPLAASVHRHVHRNLERHLTVCSRRRRASLDLRKLKDSWSVALRVDVLPRAGDCCGPKATQAVVAQRPGKRWRHDRFRRERDPQGCRHGRLPARHPPQRLGIFLGGDEPPTSRPAPARTVTAVATSGPRVLSTAPSCRSRPPVDPWTTQTAEGAEPYEAKCDGSQTLQWVLMSDRASRTPARRRTALRSVSHVPPATPPRPRPAGRTSGSTDRQPSRRRIPASVVSAWMTAQGWRGRTPLPVHRHDGQPLQVAIASIPLRG